MSHDDAESGPLPVSGDTGVEGRYHGFNLDSVCWGYRNLFERAIEGLFEEGAIGRDREEVTRKVFGLLKRADRGCFDAVLKEFLEALNPKTRWLMDLPAVFCDVVDVGRRLAESRLSYGIAFFRTLGEGGFGDTPDQVRLLLYNMRRLRETDGELAQALMRGYRLLADRLEAPEVNAYVNEGLRLFARNPQLALKFLEGTVKTSENVIEALTCECRLQDIKTTLEALLEALAGYPVSVDHLGKLDSDFLLERGTSVVCMYEWLYLPIRIRRFQDRRRNRIWYVLCAIVAAGMLTENGFCRIHGHPEYVTCRDIAGDDMLSLNLFQILEYIRVIQRIRRNWPGARRLLDFGLETEFGQARSETPADGLFREAATGGTSEAASIVRLAAEESVNCFDTAAKVPEISARVLAACPDLGRFPLRAFSFLPDMQYPGEVSAPPRDALVADLRRAARDRAGSEEEEDTEQGSGDKKSDVVASGSEEGAVEACYLYDEWSHEENDYYKDYCFLRERVPETTPGAIGFEKSLMDDVKRVRRLFEMLNPDLARRETHLDDGDLINTDLLVKYVVERHREDEPKIEFYERYITSRRDLAVLILLDISGSTVAELAAQEKVIDVEKKAALVFGHGLASLGDRFAVCGFSGNGREDCQYFVYKDFDGKWDREARERLLSAHPLGSTRIGVAIRHSGWRLSQVQARQRLIIVVTDGKPMDSGYDPNTRYAQYDVRMACEENLHMSVCTFGVCTEESSLPDMELMFPGRRFVILPDMRRLPAVLPRLYVKMTV